MIVIVFLILINVTIVLSKTHQFKGEHLITGMIPFCEDVIGGVQCGEDLYVLKGIRDDCPQGTIEKCTNDCLVEKTLKEDDRLCPNYCEQYCIPIELAQKLKSE